jgi:elongation factor P hydroxylase
MKIEHNTDQLVKLFNQLFEESENTLLRMEADEPFYQAPKPGACAIVFARNDYFSSALHEVSHWCIAGKDRRQLDDFGYWYEPEGRTAEQQTLFEQVEVKPQAIEWLLSLASGHTFHFSADNLSQCIDASGSFKESVFQQALNYLEFGLPRRAQQLFDKLNHYYRDGKKVELDYV